MTLASTEPRGWQSGFTLIEIIASLVLLGLLGVFFSFGLTTAMKGYVFTRENAETTQKGQIALLRLTKELSVVSAVSSGTATSMSYTLIKSGSGVNQAISWSGTANDPLYLGIRYRFYRWGGDDGPDDRLDLQPAVDVAPG